MRYEIRMIENIPIISAHINLKKILPIPKRRLNRLNRRHWDGIY